MKALEVKQLAEFMPPDNVPKGLAEVPDDAEVLAFSYSIRDGAICDMSVTTR